MKKRIFCISLACLMMLISFPLSVLAEDGQVENKTSNEIISDMPTTTMENENVNQNKAEELDAELKVPQEEVIKKEETNVLEENQKKMSADDQEKQEATEKQEINAAETGSFSEGEFTFSEDWDGSLYISKYSGQSEKIVVPAQTKDGRKVKKVSKLWEMDNIEGKNKIESIVFSEGIEIIDHGVLTGSGDALKNLRTLDFPSTLESSIYISNTSLINLNCFEKVTKLSNISITNNSNLTDVSALGKMDGIWYLNLRHNPELKDISALRNLGNLQDLYLEGTKVSEQDQIDFLRLTEKIEVSTELSRKYEIRPNLDLELYAVAKDTNMAELAIEYKGYNCLLVKGLSEGKTEGVITSQLNPNAQRTFPIIVNALKPDQPVGDKVENLPQIESSYTAVYRDLGNLYNKQELLSLYDNGDLWRVSGGEQEKLLSNVNNYVGAQVYNNRMQTWALIQDNNGSLWVYENRSDGRTSVKKRLEHVTKYSGLHNKGADNTERACAIDENQILWQIDSNGNQDKLMSDVQDFAVIHYYGLSKVLILTTNGELYLSDMAEKNSIKIAEQVIEIKQNFKEADDSKVTTYIQNDGSLWGVKRIRNTENWDLEFYKMDDNASIVLGDFIVKSNGTTWYQKGDLSYQVLDKTIKEYGTSRDSEWTRKYEWFLDEDNILWRIERYSYYEEKPSQPMPEKIAEKVKELYLRGNFLDNFEGYLLENGDYYNKNNEKTASNVLDIYDEYVLKRDHVVYLEETAILDHVSSLFRGKYYSVDGMIMIRDDGSLWVSNNQGDATPYMIKDYIKEVPVTNVKLEQSTLMLTQGYSAQLQATIEPEKATNQKVSWTSSSPDIATVENGLVIGVKEGEAMITVTTEDGNKTAECKVTVKIAAPVLNPDSGTAEGIVSGETGQNFVDKLKENSIIGGKDQVNLLKADGQEVSLDTPLVTGMKVVITIGPRMFNRNAAVTQEYTIVVLGDITGDGNINIMDMLAAQDDILGKEKLEGCYRTAADITGDDAVNIMDMLAIQDDILGKEKINPYV